MPKNTFKYWQQNRLHYVMNKRKVKACAYLNHYYRNITNLIKYGFSAPRFYELIWLHPKKCSMLLPFNALKNLFGAKDIIEISGLVIQAQWPFEAAVPISADRRIKICMEHWVNGLSWEETGVYEYEKKLLEKEGYTGRYKNMSEVKKRYENLDLIFEQVNLEGRLKTAEELQPGQDQRRGETFFHIGPNGEPFWGGGGANHRFAIAYILRVPLAVRVGCVHVSAIPYLDQYRMQLPTS